MLGVSVTPANVQDRDGFLPLLKEVRRLFVFLQRLFADGGYSGDETWAATKRVGKVNLEIVRRSDTTKGFVVVPKRWIVERTFGWLNRCRRLAKDFENLTRTQLAFIQLAMIRLMARRIARCSKHHKTAGRALERNPLRLRRIRRRRSSWRIPAG